MYVPVQLTLADICPVGNAVHGFLEENLLGEYVYVDVDSHGTGDAMVYAPYTGQIGANGIAPGVNVNKLVVELGLASIADNPANEFSPAEW